MSEQIRFVERQNSDSEKWRKFAPEVIPAWVADMDCAAAAPIIDALQSRLRHGVLGYSSASDALPKIAAAYFERRWNWQIQPEWLLYSPGLGASIYNVCRLADEARPGILTPQPIYHVFRTAPALMRRQRVDAAMVLDGDTWQLPIAALEEAIMQTPCSIFQLCNPHNPNGKVYTRAELEEIAEFCLRHDLLICADEVHADLILDDDKRHIPIASLSPEVARRTITMQSPSKAFNVAGLNFAVVVIPDDNLQRRYQAMARGNVLSNLNPFGFIAASVAWSGICDSWLTAAIGWLRNNRNRLSAVMAKMDGVTMPPLTATSLAWLNIEKLALSDAPAHFLQHGIGMSPGGDFGDSRYMRLNFGCSPERLENIIERFRTAVAAAQ